MKTSCCSEFGPFLFRHHGEAPAVGRRLSQLLRVPSGGQHVALSAASLHRAPGGHQHPPTLLGPAAGSTGQPQHRAAGEAEEHRYENQTLALALPPRFLSSVHPENFFLPAGSEYMPLGHMLTFKVAYQIAVGLAYLHRKNIIFCDLKSDNILVWSLQVCTGTTTKN